MHTPSALVPAEFNDRNNSAAVSVTSTDTAESSTLPNSLPQSQPQPQPSPEPSTPSSLHIETAQTAQPEASTIPPPEPLASSSSSSSPTSNEHRRSRVLVDDYGFLVLDESDGLDALTAETPKDEDAIQAYREREARWLSVLSLGDPKSAKKNKKVKRLIRQGIPESLRGRVWLFLSGASTMRQPGVYEELLKAQRIPIYEIIERDINRCYPDHVLFKEDNSLGQTDLYNILKAYAHYNPSVGYCQGMGRLVGMMLMQMPAEDTFWLLVATLGGPMLGYFTPSLAQLRIDSIVFEKLLAGHTPRLAQHLADQEVVPLMYMTNWFMTIFTMALPWASVLRVWDMFYFEGGKVFFRVGLAILDCCRDHLLRSCPTNSELLCYLLHIPPEMLTPERLLAAAAKVRLRSAEIEKLKRMAVEIGLPDRGTVQLGGVKKKKLTKISGNPNRARKEKEKGKGPERREEQQRKNENEKGRVNENETEKARRK